MLGKVAIELQDFADARPRRFGKTLNLSRMECFFPIRMQAGKSFLRGCPYGRRRRIGIYKGLRKEV